MPTTWLLIRHGDAGAAGHLCGRSDPPLTASGRLQAAAAADALSAASPAAIYCSNLVRSVQTATCVADVHGLMPEQVPGLAERAFGAWDGRPVAVLHREAPDLLARLWEDAGFAPPGGERADQVADRVGDAILRLSARHRGAVTVAVTHGGPVRMLLGRLTGMPLSGLMRIDLSYGNGTVIDCYEDGGIGIRGINLPPAAWPEVLCRERRFRAGSAPSSHLPQGGV